MNEIYSRSIQVDRHAESSGNSLPSPDVDVFCGIISDADGYGIKNKFVIGTNTINILSYLLCGAGHEAQSLRRRWCRSPHRRLEFSRQTQLQHLLGDLALRLFVLV